MDENVPEMEPDPVIDAYREGIDLTLIRENLRLTPEQRLQNLMALVLFAEKVRAAGRLAGGEDNV